MANLYKITQEQYTALKNGSSIDLNGKTYTYEEDAIYVISDPKPIIKVPSLEDVENDELLLSRYSEGEISSRIVETVSEYHEGSEGHNYTKITTDNNKTLSDVLSQFDSSINNFVSISDPVQVYSACYTYNNEQILNGIRLGSSKNQGSFTITLTQECQLIANKYFAINGSTGEVASSDANSQIIVDGTVYMLAGEEDPVSITLSEGTHTISSGSGSSSRCFILGFTFGGESFYTYEKKHLARHEDLIDLTNVVEAHKTETNTAITTLEKTITTNAQTITAVEGKIGEVQIYNAKPYLPKASTDYLDKIYRYENNLYQCLKTGDGEHKEFSFALTGTSEITEAHLENIYRELGIKTDENFIELSGLSKVFRNNDSIKLGSSSSIGYFDLDFINEKPITALKIGLRAYNTKNSVFHIYLPTENADYEYDILVKDSTTEKLVDLYQYIRNSGASNEEVIDYISISTVESIIDEETGETIYVDPRGCITRIIADFGDVTYEWIPVSSAGIKHVTYAELKNLRDNSKLIPGQQYRIIDYVTTTIQEDTQSAGHQFDIIVTADDEKTLNENVRAAIHEGDNYFSTTSINSSVLYVAYYVYETDDGEEHNHGADYWGHRQQAPESIGYDNNDIPIIYISSKGFEGVINEYSDYYKWLGQETFDGQVYDKWQKCNDKSKNSRSYIYTPVVVVNNRFIDSAYTIKEASKLSAWEIKYCLDNDINRFAWADNRSAFQFNDGNSYTCVSRYPAGDADGRFAWGFVIGSANDPINWDAVSDFEPDSSDLYFTDSPNIQDITAIYADLSFDNPRATEVYSSFVPGKGVIYFMKDEWGNECSYDFKNIQFIRKLTDGDLDSENGIDTWCYTFNGYDENEGEIYDLSVIVSLGFKNDENGDCTCQENIISAAHDSSENRGYYYGNTRFLNDIVFLNIITNYSSRFSDHWLDCSFNIFDSDCCFNTFGSSCCFNTFSNDCSYNTFGYNCSYNTFGYYCSYNTFEEWCSYNTFGNNCRNNIFMETYICYNEIKSGVCYINLTSTSPDTTAFHNLLKNIIINPGVKGKGSDNKRTITIERNLPYSTTILASGSKEIILDEEE